MKIIFLEDIPSVARKYDVKDVRDGYARNFLLPRHLAEAASPAALKTVEGRKARASRESAEDAAHHEKLAERLKTRVFVISMKMTESGTTFGAVGAEKIEDALKKEGISIDKKWIVLDAPIKSAGDYEATIEFPSGLKGILKFKVEAEGI